MDLKGRLWCLRVPKVWDCRSSSRFQAHLRQCSSHARVVLGYLMLSCLISFLPYERLIICSSHMHFQTLSTRWKKAHVNTVVACQYLSWLYTESFNNFWVSERVDVTQLASVHQTWNFQDLYILCLLCQLSILEHETRLEETQDVF